MQNHYLLQRDQGDLQYWPVNSSERCKESKWNSKGWKWGFNLHLMYNSDLVCCLAGLQSKELLLIVRIA